MPSVLLERENPNAEEPPKSPRGTNEWLERELIGHAMHAIGSNFVSSTVLFDWYVNQGWSLTPHPSNNIPVMLLEMGKEGPWRESPIRL